MNLGEALDSRSNRVDFNELMVQGTQRANGFNGQSHISSNLLQRISGKLFVATTIMKMIKHLAAVINLVKNHGSTTLVCLKNNDILVLV